MLWEEFCVLSVFHPKKLFLFLILFGTKICMGNIFLQYENCNVIIFSALCFFLSMVVKVLGLYVSAVSDKAGG